MTLALLSLILGCLNMSTLWLALNGYKRWAAWLTIFFQIPWTVYDIATGQFGFLVITAGSLFIAWRVISSKHADNRRCTCDQGSGTEDKAAGTYCEVTAEATGNSAGGDSVAARGDHR
jgi:hypothetical protein